MIKEMNNKEKIRKTSMLKKAFIMTIVFVSFFANQETKAQAGGSAVPFLTISPDARTSGMGEAGTAIADDIFAIFWNPAGLAFHDWINPDTEYDEDLKPYRQVSLAFSKWLPQFNADLYYSYGNYGQYVESIDGTIGINITYMHLGEFTRTYENGQVAGKFLSNEFSIGGSYGTIIANDLGIGFQLKYIQSNLAPATSQTDVAGVGRSVAFDLGLLWKPQNINLFGWDAGDFFAFGFNLQNVGPKVTYRNESDPLPTTLRLGSAFHLYSDDYNDLTFAFDASKLLVYRDSLGSDPLPPAFITAWKNPGMELSMGFEYWYSHIIAIRAGYFTEPATLGNRQFWNFGASVRYDIFRADFSFINTIEENHPLGNTMRFSLLIDWR
jgi:hypothetical protein